MTYFLPYGTMGVAHHGKRATVKLDDKRHTLTHFTITGKQATLQDCEESDKQGIFATPEQSDKQASQ